MGGTRRGLRARSRTFAAVAPGLAALVAAVRGRAPRGGPAAGGGETRIRPTEPHGGHPAAARTPKSGGVLVMGTDREAAGFDTTVLNTNQAATAIYDSLLKLEDGKPEPYMAESMESPDGGRTWLLGLRDGVRFSDGTPLDAQAV